MTTSQRNGTITIDTERFAAEARMMAYAMVNAFVTQHSIVTEALAMRPAKLLVFMVIIVATVQRSLRDPDFPAELHGSARMARAQVGYISRRAIAEASGLPRENVRRIVEELLEEGRLIVGPRGDLYVVDRHHWLRAREAEAIEVVEVTIMADLSRLDYQAFWAELERHSWCHPHDAAGTRRNLADLPPSISALTDDPYRSLASALRRAENLPKPASLFSECKLANALREALSPGLVEADFDAALDAAIKLLPAREVAQINVLEMNCSF